MTTRAKRLFVSCVALALAFIAIAWSVDRYTVNAQMERAADRAALLRSLRRSTLEGYFDTVRTELTFWSDNQSLVDAMMELQESWRLLGPAAQEQLQDHYLANSEPKAPARESRSYHHVHDKLHDVASEFVTERGYYDFFLIDVDGNIVYTVEKESDFATNLRTGPWADSGLGDAFRRAAGHEGRAVALSDFTSYQPSAGAPAMFVARSMLDSNANPIGVIALQLPTDRIQYIMQFTEGMGRSGETYLVGQDLLMRSDSRFSDESTTLLTSVDTEAVRRALAGETGIMITPDYRGIEVLSAFDSMNVGEAQWAVLAEVDRAEIEYSIREARRYNAIVTFGMYLLAIFTAWFVRPFQIIEGVSGGAVSSDLGDMSA